MVECLLFAVAGFAFGALVYGALSFAEWMTRDVDRNTRDEG